MELKEKVVSLHKQGYNCCQSVLMAHKDLTGYSEEELTRLGAGFLGGMATGKGTCGALVGAQMIMGIKEYQGKQIPRNARALCAEFEKRCGAVICSDLKGMKTGQVLCSCDDCIYHAAKIIDELYSADNAKEDPWAF